MAILDRVAPCAGSDDAFWWKLNKEEIDAPSKSLLFGWRLIHDRLATKDHLFKKGILEIAEINCAFCSVEEECLAHLLGGCLVVKPIWLKVFDWLGSITDFSLVDFITFPFISDKVHSPAKRKIIGAIWLATCWHIWLIRNAIIFKDGNFSFLDCMSEIMHSSWNWLCSSGKLVKICNFHV
ncbi:uncharacterized protein LOC131618836 [Vicia villosa]|uniref:uncharacterized protein LOC131618835 n=1 Tax=Vicia villosa TaxID=3911 RepID=UPI00273B6DC7|nr:uncharacterized protein LOC131618835 [Vicia villosa]XP_058745977.1 uncharacterized protein LOC131618836 [Vicia villosa]